MTTCICRALAIQEAREQHGLNLQRLASHLSAASRVASVSTLLPRPSTVHSSCSTIPVYRHVILNQGNLSTRKSILDLQVQMFLDWNAKLQGFQTEWNGGRWWARRHRTSTCTVQQIYINEKQGKSSLESETNLDKFPGRCRRKGLSRYRKVNFIERAA